jgi:hypothetical protein
MYKLAFQWRITMKSKTFDPISVLFSLLVAISLYAGGPADEQSKQPTSAAGSTQQAAIDLRGTWSGTFFSKHSNVAPFTMTVVISPNSNGHLVGSSTLNSDCLKGAQLEVTVAGPKIVLAGSDEEGDSITVQGTVDNAGTLLTASYILNGSASGRCETDDGTGDLAKR